MATTPPLPDLDHLRLLLDQVDGRLAYQRDEWDGLDRKGTTVLATTGVVLGLVVNNAKAFQTFPAPAPELFLLALLVLIAGLGAGVLTLWPRPFKVVPEPGPLLADYAGKPSDYTIGRVLRTKADAFGINQGPMRWKLRALRAQMALLTAAGVLLLVVLVIGRSTP